ncbi:general transcription factor II-I repeat domain-containing protein 2-like [Silurus meridionalis]|nr:general transcription factor II-I repeat domain-containing protein 2-like [Silurus meridionalis]
MMIIAKTVLKDEKYGTDVISTLSDVQLGATTMLVRVSAMSGNLANQLDRDLAKRRWFSIQCDESVDSSSTAQLMVFLSGWCLMISPQKKILLPLKTTTRRVDIYNTVKEFFAEKKVPLVKLVSVTTDGAPAMISRNSGFIAHCKGDQSFRTSCITTASFTSRRYVQRNQTQKENYPHLGDIKSVIIALNNTKHWSVRTSVQTPHEVESKWHWYVSRWFGMFAGIFLVHNLHEVGRDWSWSNLRKPQDGERKRSSGEELA